LQGLLRQGLGRLVIGWRTSALTSAMLRADTLSSSTPGRQHRHRQRVGRQLAAHAHPLAMGMGGAHGDVDQLQHRRVQAVGLGRRRVATVDGQGVLGQVVGADAEEVDFLASTAPATQRTAPRS
jgi:hypothetical protein